MKDIVVTINLKQQWITTKCQNQLFFISDIDYSRPLSASNRFIKDAPVLQMAVQKHQVSHLPHLRHHVTSQYKISCAKVIGILNTTGK